MADSPGEITGTRGRSQGRKATSKPRPHKHIIIKEKNKEYLCFFLSDQSFAAGHRRPSDALWWVPFTGGFQPLKASTSGGRNSLTIPCGSGRNSSCDRAQEQVPPPHEGGASVSGVQSQGQGECANRQCELRGDTCSAAAMKILKQ
jgi:hypothetical protein